jgi:hypothetical protein
VKNCAKELGRGEPQKSQKVAVFGRFSVASRQVIRYNQGTARRSHT